jgi:hypothetical protein
MKSNQLNLEHIPGHLVFLNPLSIVCMVCIISHSYAYCRYKREDIGKMKCVRHTPIFMHSVAWCGYTWASYKLNVWEKKTVKV